MTSTNRLVRLSGLTEYCLDHYSSWRRRYELLVLDALNDECRQSMRSLLHQNSWNGLGISLYDVFPQDWWNYQFRSFLAYGYSICPDTARTLNALFDLMGLHALLTIRPVNIRQDGFLLEYLVLKDESSREARLNLLCVFRLMQLFNEWAAAQDRGVSNA